MWLHRARKEKDTRSRAIMKAIKDHRRTIGATGGHRSKRDNKEQQLPLDEAKEA